MWGTKSIKQVLLTFFFKSFKIFSGKSEISGYNIPNSRSFEDFHNKYLGFVSE